MCTICRYVHVYLGGGREFLFLERKRPISPKFVSHIHFKNQTLSFFDSVVKQLVSLLKHGIINEQLQLATGHPVPGSVLPPPPPVPRPPPTFSEGPSPSSAQPFAAPPLPPRPASTPASTRGPTATEREDSESPDAMLMMIDDGFEDRARASHPHAAPSSRGVPVSSNMLGNGGTGGLMPGASGGGGGSAPSSFPSTTRHLMGPPPPPPLFSSGGGGGMGEEAGSPEGGAFNPAVPPRMLGTFSYFYFFCI